VSKIAEERDTIAAVATPPGRGGVGVIRLSGPRARAVAWALAPPLPRPRQAALRVFTGRGGEAVDRGLVLFFPGPHSFTGEDVVELQAHGSPVVLDELLAAVFAAGARHARPGEFSERAFLNGRMDLTQAEAVADLIDAGSQAAARAALASLEGRFSARVNEAAAELMRLRVETEARLDFADEDIAAETPGFRRRLGALAEGLRGLAASAARGQRLTEGYVCVLSGPPNAGKSSLLNALAGSERAIVTELPGTTRDPVEVDVILGGVPVRLVDTAGVRETDDPVESEGVRRALARAAEADLVVDIRDDAGPVVAGAAAGGIPRLTVLNKIDLSGRAPGPCGDAGAPAVAVSAGTGAGLEALVAELRARAIGGSDAEGARFSARRRHLDALERAGACLARAAAETDGELAAEELAAAQRALGEITGETTTEDLLGAIFSTFCIGK